MAGDSPGEVLPRLVLGGAPNIAAVGVLTVRLLSGKGLPHVPRPAGCLSSGLLFPPDLALSTKDRLELTLSSSSHCLVKVR